MKIRLNRAHTHAGVAHAPGTVLDVAAHDAQWLTSRGIAEAVPPEITRPRRAMVLEEKAD